MCVRVCVWHLQLFSFIFFFFLMVCFSLCFSVRFIFFHVSFPYCHLVFCVLRVCSCSFVCMLASTRSSCFFFIFFFFVSQQTEYLFLLYCFDRNLIYTPFTKVSSFFNLFVSSVSLLSLSSSYFRSALFSFVNLFHLKKKMFVRVRACVLFHSIVHPVFPRFFSDLENRPRIP